MVGAKQLATLSDSLLVTNQINRVYKEKDPRMQKYLDTVCSLANTFKSFSIKQISRGKNAQEDALSKLASTSYDHLTKKVLVEVLLERSIDNQKVNTISSLLEWTKPFADYLRHGVHPDDPQEVRKVKIKALHFAIRDNQLYRRGYLRTWIKYISKMEGWAFLEESHSGEMEKHEGAHALTCNILRLGVY